MSFDLRKYETAKIYVTSSSTGYLKLYNTIRYPLELSFTEENGCLWFRIRDVEGTVYSYPIGTFYYTLVRGDDEVLFGFIEN